LIKGNIMKATASLLILALLAGCATSGANYVPVIDTKGKNMSELQQNLMECQQFAKQRADAAQGAVVGAVLGGLFLAALAGGGQRNYAARQGAIVGGVSGAAGANESQEVIIKRCMAGRGYNVLN
jgi:uncharacterized protein YcfJ